MVKNNNYVNYAKSEREFSKFLIELAEHVDKPGFARMFEVCLNFRDASDELLNEVILSADAFKGVIKKNFNDNILPHYRSIYYQYPC